MLRQYHFTLFDLITFAGGGSYYFYDDPPLIVFLRDVISFLLDPLVLLALLVVAILLLLMSPRPRSRVEGFSASHYTREAEAYRVLAHELDSQTAQIDSYIATMRARAEADEFSEVLEHEKMKRELRERNRS